MASRRVLLVATTNAGKVREIRAVLQGLTVELVALSDLGSIPEPVEDADNLEGNARLKALYYSDRTNMWTLADDSGLEVDALGGAPGVRSSRFAGEGSTDQENNVELISRLAGIPADKRTARFRCVVVLARAQEVLASATGAVEGRIVDVPSGENGFGYDPHFWLPGLNQTMAQLSPEQKNRISHRGRALSALRSELVRILREI